MAADRVNRPCAAAAATRADLDEAIRRAFWTVLHRGPLPPMDALQVAARTIGTLYRQMAQAHDGPGGCACGWEPDPDGDLVVLEAQLAAALLQPPSQDLAQMATMGQA
ncbi:hypothetical protein ASG40_04270 [Methylobacterium sp. Leaf399]|uniref:hypothetical protein n=1 Tax=unclassified Methylobacterium TaxID=2615210 RepID=UPI0006FDB1D7|nr:MULTISPECIES: hypothetical protein [unclassified Methylobacterium]KQP61658.1 hypothetical protein ASF39_03030 [Methylobacterium sp. Leaf108]KQT20017.1 hypothetical protein ASG40_04270 [Methylobacterium sp. Leaf399]